MEKNVQHKYRLYRRRNGKYYWQENGSTKQGSLRTTERREAERLLNAMNESHRHPTLNLSLARAYLAAHDPEMSVRTWQSVMNEMATHGIPTTQERCARAFHSKAYNALRHRPLVQTTGSELLAILHANGNCVAHYLRRLHNLAVDLGWLAWPILTETRLAENPNPTKESDHCRRACSDHRNREKRRTPGILRAALRDWSSTERRREPHHREC
jgi:hypothetical protein